MLDWAPAGSRIAKRHKVSKICSHPTNGLAAMIFCWMRSAAFTTSLPFYPKWPDAVYRLLILLFPALLYTNSLADTAKFPGDQPVNPFQKEYLLVESIANFPISQSLENFRPYQRTLGITYTHVLGSEWIVGVSSQFKSMRRKDIDREFALLSFSNQAQYVIRLHHPFYLLVGGKWLYMVASQRARFPLIKDPNFETEIGAGLTASFNYILKEDWLLSLRLDRWRGTNTNRLHGFEVAMGLGRSLKF